MQGAIADDCMEAGGRAMQGAIAECVPFVTLTVRTAYPTKRCIIACRFPTVGLAETPAYAKKGAHRISYPEPRLC
jgi:hypothetical protein